MLTLTLKLRKLLAAQLRERFGRTEEGKTKEQISTPSAALEVTGN
jgi:hypothetical protein